MRTLQLSYSFRVAIQEEIPFYLEIPLVLPRKSGSASFQHETLRLLIGEDS